MPYRSHEESPRHSHTAPVERFAYGIGALLILSGLVHLALLIGTGDSWSGPLSWRKPMTFGLSFGLTVLTIAWVSNFLDLRARTRTVVLSVFTAACAMETALVTLQAWRGRPSHFNVETPIDTLIAQSLALGGVVLVSVIVMLAIAAFRTRAAALPSMRLAIRAGFAALLGAQIVGALMIARGMRLVFAGRRQTAYATGGALKPAHAILMHAVVILPALAWLLSRVAWSEDRRRTVVLLATIGYALLAGGVVLANLRELGATDVALPIAALLVTGAASFITASVVTLIGLVQTAGLRFSHGS